MPTSARAIGGVGAALIFSERVMLVKITGILILVALYFIYFLKMFLQRQKGIQTDQLAKGEKNKVFYIELITKLAIYAVVGAEVVSIFAAKDTAMGVAEIIGIIISIFGIAIFGTAVVTMRDSWRAGIAEKDKTDIVTHGIYSISRNPAFLGFDCVYLGILLMFFNIPLLIISVFAAVMLHLQILQEEQYLPGVFGEEYIKYKNKVCRYIGRKL